MAIIKIRNEYFVPLSARSVIYIGIASIGYFQLMRSLRTNNFYATILIVAISFVLLLIIGTTRNVFKLNLSSKKIEEYVWFLGFRFGSVRSYDSIEKIFVNRSKVVQKNQYFRWISVSNVDSDVIYSGYLLKSFMKLNDGTKLFLISDNDKNRLMVKLHKINNVLNTSIQDNTK